VSEKLDQPIGELAARAGGLSPDGARLVGLPEGIAVLSGTWTRT